MTDHPILAGLIWAILTILVVTAITAVARFRGPLVLVGVYVGLIITSAIAATKIIALPGTSLAVPAGVIIYSVSFLITDILAECYPDGKRHAATAVWTGFLMMLVYWLYSWVTVEWAPASFWENQTAYATILTQSWRIAAAGAFAFLISQLLDIYLFRLIRSWTGSKWLWLRNNGSTWVSQAVDSCLFISIAFVGTGFPIVQMIIAQYIAKVVIAALDTPFIYIAVRVLRSGDSQLQPKSSTPPAT